MLVESLIQREGGTEVILGGVTYVFLPNDSGIHVCEVTNPAHIERLLSIKEGFVEIKTQKPKAVKAS